MRDGRILDMHGSSDAIRDKKRENEKKNIRTRKRKRETMNMKRKEQKRNDEWWMSNDAKKREQETRRWDKERWTKEQEENGDKREDEKEK